MLNDTLAAALSKIVNYEKTGKNTCMLTPVSSIIKQTLTILQDNKYLGESEEITDKRGGVLKINLLGSINKIGVVKPRFAVKVEDFEKFEKRFLPAKGVGLLIISTPKGIMTLDEAKKKHLGGKLLAYCY